MGIALASLISGIVALYLHLWKLGLTGTLACTGSGGCEYVQGSRYGWFLGVDVALIGTVMKPAKNAMATESGEPSPDVWVIVRSRAAFAVPRAPGRTRGLPRPRKSR